VFYKRKLVVDGEAEAGMFGIKRLGTKEKKWSDFEAEAMPLTPDLYRLAMWLTRNKEEAEDLLQETFFQALKSFHRYEMGTNCRAWLATIMYHLNSKRLQKMGRMKLADDSEEKLAETIPFEPSIPQKITDEDVLAALGSVDILSEPDDSAGKLNKT